MTNENPSKSTSTISTITPSGVIGCDLPPIPVVFQRDLQPAHTGDDPETVRSCERNARIALERRRRTFRFARPRGLRSIPRFTEAIGTVLQLGQEPDVR